MGNVTDYDPWLILSATDAEEEWSAIMSEVKLADACVRFIDDPMYQGLHLNDVLLALPESFTDSFVFVADQITCDDPEHPIVVVDLWDEPGRHFRAIPKAVAIVEANLSIAKCGFEDFLDAVEDDGVFRFRP